jgi:ABC-type glycerol-3-phosphate transport system substrate-binding protein
MEKLLSIICMLMLIFIMLTGCYTVPRELASPSEIFDSPIDLTPSDELVIWLTPGADWALGSVINRFRYLYPDVNLIIENVDEGQGNNVYSARISTEIAAGRGPDLILPARMTEVDMYKAANSGAYLDLNKIIEQDDDFNLDDYVKGALDGGIYRDRRYIMPITFVVPVYISIPEKLDEIGFDMSTINDTISFFDEVARTLPNALKKPNFKSIFDLGIGFPVLSRTSGIRLVDFETNTVFPDEEMLKNLLISYQPYYSIDSRILAEFYSPPLPSDLLNGTYIFGVEEIIYGFISRAGHIKSESNYQINVIPDMDGKTRARARGLSVAIRSGSTNQLNAWNFIKLLLAPEFQSTTGLSFTPVHKDSISVVFDRHHNNAEKFPQHGVFTRLTEEEKWEYISLITNLEYTYTYRSTPIYDMFDEHMTPYFEGEVSYETAINGLKNQLRLYVSE